jgi:hypothetical protein
MGLFYCQKHVKRKPAGVAELVDAQDLKSCGGNPVPVRFRPSAFFKIWIEMNVFAPAINTSHEKEYMTNQSLRERFHLPESKSVIISQIISSAIEEGMVKQDLSTGQSRKYARYLPFWA